VHELQLLATVPCHQTIDLDRSKLEFRALRGFRGGGVGWGVYDVPCRSRARGIQG
jgi:hypothetical protein